MPRKTKTYTWNTWLLLKDFELRCAPHKEIKQIPICLRGVIV